MQGSKKFSFTKQQRLCSRKIIAQLFDGQATVAKYPLRLVYMLTPLPVATEPAQVAISVSKRYSKRAVDRNLIKRRIREAYRLNKHILFDYLTERNLQIALMVIYTGREEATYTVLTEKLTLLLHQLTKQLNEKAVG